MRNLSETVPLAPPRGWLGAACAGVLLLLAESVGAVSCLPDGIRPGPQGDRAADGTPEPAARAARLRLAGRLAEAEALLRRRLAAESLPVVDEIALRLELARVLDRVGLHRATRPVTEALEEIERAAQRVEDTDAAARGRIEAARAYYHYRAEMREGGFERATEHASRAIALLEAAGSDRAAADAVHLLGLVRLQRGEAEEARRLFDHSLELDQRAGAREWFRGEYHRHVALLATRAGEWELALPDLERSWICRQAAGAVDAGLFAAVSYGTALVRAGRADRARHPLEEALATARDLGSPIGTALAALHLGRTLEATDRLPAAAEAYAEARDAAAAVGHAGLTGGAEEALQRLDRADGVPRSE